MSTDIIFDFIADPSQAMVATGEMEAAIEALKKEAETVATLPAVIPPAVKQGEGQLLTMYHSYRMVSSAMQVAGIHSQALGSSMLTLAAAQNVVSQSGGSLVTALKLVATSTKDFLVAIGPVGWALITIVGVVKGATAIFKAHKQSAEETARAIKEFTEAEQQLADKVKDVSIKILEVSGRTFEARRAEALKTKELELRAIDDLWAKQYDALTRENTTRQEFRIRYDTLTENSNQARSNAEKLYSETIKQIAREELAIKVDAIEKEEQARRDAAVNILEDLKREEEFLGKSAGYILKRRLEILGWKAAEAEAAGALKDKIDLLQKEAEINKEHQTTMTELNWKIEMNNAILEGNVSAQKELLIVERMRAGLTREQAEAEVRKTQVVEKQQEAIKEMNEALKEEEDIQEQLNQSRQVGLEQLYEGIQLAAASPRGAVEVINPKTAVVTSSPIQSSGNQAVSILEKIYDLMRQIQPTLSSVGALV